MVQYADLVQIFKKYFSGRMSDGKKSCRVVAFGTALRSKVEKINPGKEPCVNRELPNEAGKLQHCMTVKINMKLWLPLGIQ